MEDGDGRRDVGADEARLPKDEGVSAVLSHIGGSIGVSPLVFLLGFVGTYEMQDSMLWLEASILGGEYPGTAKVMLRLRRNGELMMRLLFLLPSASEEVSQTSPSCSEFLVFVGCRRGQLNIAGDGRGDEGADETRLPIDEGVSAVLSPIGGSTDLSPLVFFLGFDGLYEMQDSMLWLEASPGCSELVFEGCRGGRLNIPSIPTL